MNKLSMYIAAAAAAVLSAPAAFATMTVSTVVASKYFDANWALNSTRSQPHQPATRAYEERFSSYFDANWALQSNDGQPAEQSSEETYDANTN